MTLAIKSLDLFELVCDYPYLKKYCCPLKLFIQNKLGGCVTDL